MITKAQAQTLRLLIHEAINAAKEAAFAGSYPPDEASLMISLAAQASNDLNAYIKQLTEVAL